MMERCEWNRHHTLWTRKAHQRTRHNRLLRNSANLIVPLPIDIHRDLHANVHPPIVPGKELAETLLREPLPFKGILGLLEKISEQDTIMSEQAYQLAYNFKLQAEIMGQIYEF